MDYSAMSILLVEPSQAQTRFVQHCLLTLGCSCVHTCHTKKEALTLIQQGLAPDLVISAMYLPDGDGSGLAMELRANERQRDVMFALLSSEKNPQYLEPLRQLGVIALMSKPIDADQMRSALDAVQNITAPRDLQIQDYLDEIRVLMADDSRTARQFMRRVLRSLGLERITEAEDGQKAAELLSSSSFDILITDLHMPNMDGLELARYVRTESLNPSLPIMMVTSEQSKAFLDRCKLAGANYVLDKPFEPALVREVLENLLAV